jgi:hypothetical protein
MPVFQRQTKISSPFVPLQRGKPQTSYLSEKTYSPFGGGLRGRKLVKLNQDFHFLGNAQHD